MNKALDCGGCTFFTIGGSAGPSCATVRAENMLGGHFMPTFDKTNCVAYVPSADRVLYELYHTRRF